MSELERCRYLEEELPTPQVFRQDIQHPYHLGEDENPVASLLQADQQLVQQNQLPAAAHQLLRGQERKESEVRGGGPSIDILSLRVRAGTRSLSVSSRTVC